ncbi:hypothetical protein GCM10023314_12420 [Algibacter agarivorans]|uniref:Activator of Hsp90 ATPase homolog 1-like protein n=1 Tax=Algibacter agarivorans TaxID=1109741 RepID=A0ABP9GGY3_9FLAO
MMTKTREQKTEECCPKFHPEKWDNKTFNWNNKPFIKASVPTFFHIPYPPMIGKQLTRMMKMAENSKMITANKEDVLVLFSDPHPFKSEILLSVNGSVHDATNTTLTGTFMSKVFDGNYNAIPKFIKEMDAHLESKKQEG